MKMSHRGTAGRELPQTANSLTRAECAFFPRAPCKSGGLTPADPLQEQKRW